MGDHLDGGGEISHLTRVQLINLDLPRSQYSQLIDRIFLPGFAFKYRENSKLWDRLLTGRSARLLVTMDTPGWYYRFVSRQPGHQMMRRTILGFSGVKPVRIARFGPVRGSTESAREKWLNRAHTLGRRDAGRDR
jgi:putative NADPH-quinone reductase